MGIRPYARGYADYIFGNRGSQEGDEGIFRDTVQGEKAFDFGKGLDLAGLYNLIGGSVQAGGMGRQLGAEATNNAFGYGGNLMGAGAGLASLMPNVMDASNHFLQKGNNALDMFSQANTAAHGDLAAAQQVLGNVMDPTAYNPLFQSANARQNASIAGNMASRGLAGSGPGMMAEASSNLSDQFASRQFQEQLGALQQTQQASGNMANIAGGYGNLSGMLAQLPASIWGQMGSGLTGLGGLGGLQQGAVGTGMDLWRTGTSLPLETIQDIYNITRGPQLAGGQLISSSN